MGSNSGYLLKKIVLNATEIFTHCMIVARRIVKGLIRNQPDFIKDHSFEFFISYRYDLSQLRTTDYGHPMKA